jgi:hypothetical protein
MENDVAMGGFSIKIVAGAALLLLPTACAKSTTSQPSVSPVAVSSTTGASTTSPTGPATAEAVTTSPTTAASTTAPSTTTTVQRTTTTVFKPSEDATSITFMHPSWGIVRLVTALDTSPGTGSLTAVDAAGVSRWSWSTQLAYLIEPYGAKGGSGGSIDARGHLFIRWNPGRYDGVIVLNPTVDGFEDFGSLPNDTQTTGRFYPAETGDVNGDGAGDITVEKNNCKPDCAGGIRTSDTYRWDGSDFAAPWPFGDVRSVPAMGSEPVKGSGCGLSGDLGDHLPDGWWFGTVDTLTTATLDFDLGCAYFGPAAEELIRQCEAKDPTRGFICTNYSDSTFWPVNSNPKLWPVPRDKSFELNYDERFCRDYDREGRTKFMKISIAWIHIENGRAIYMRQGCPFG